MANSIISKTPTYCKSISKSGSTPFYLHHSDLVLLMTDRGGMWTESAMNRSTTTINSYSDLSLTRESSGVLKIVYNGGGSVVLTAISAGEMSFSDSAT